MVTPDMLFTKHLSVSRRQSQIHLPGTSKPYTEKTYVAKPCTILAQSNTKQTTKDRFIKYNYLIQDVHLDRRCHMFCLQSHPHCQRRLSAEDGKDLFYKAGQFPCSVCHRLHEGHPIYVCIIKKYLLVALYNAPTNINHSSRVQHDMYGQFFQCVFNRVPIFKYIVHYFSIFVPIF